MPKYTTPIPTDGPNGNTFFVLREACGMLRQLGHAEGEIQYLRDRVLGAHSYKEAMDAIRYWFPLDVDADLSTGG